VALSFVNIIVDQIWLKATIFRLLMKVLQQGAHFCTTFGRSPRHDKVLQ
jgi:hypothetical protein